MYSIAIQLTSISAEKLSPIIPPRINFNANLSLPSSEPIKKTRQYIIPFIFTITSAPPTLQIVLKGNVIVSSDSDSEFKKLSEDIDNKRIPPPIIQTVFVNSIADSILLSRALGLPPPVPGPFQPADADKDAKKEKEFKQQTVI